MQNEERSRIIEVFLDVEAHRTVANIIRKHSTNKRDVRQIALDDLDLTQCKNILDLGCGFGFFTEALKSRVHAQATVAGIDIVREYESPFLDTCRRARLKGLFLASNAHTVQKLKDQQFDLILCSYALYFFSDLIPHIARALKPEGLFISITHDEKNMKELVDAAKEALRQSHFIKTNDQPIESIIRNFSGQNGYELLSPWFKTIVTTDYENALLFKPVDTLDLVEYFRFKSPFFLSSGISLKAELVCDVIEQHLEKIFREKDAFVISKDDTIFTCTEPFQGITHT